MMPTDIHRTRVRTLREAFVSQDFIDTIIPPNCDKYDYAIACFLQMRPDASLYAGIEFYHPLGIKIIIEELGGH